jgi:hypothetical protein
MERRVALFLHRNRQKVGEHPMSTPATTINRAKRGGAAELHLRYPAASVVTYNAATIVHFLLGGLGITLGYSFSSWAGYTFGLLYVVLSLLEMYVVMPLSVCPNCSYHRTRDSLCVSGLNVWSRKIAKTGHQKDFVKRAQGVLCQNNLYVASLLIPIAAMIPAIFINFSAILLLIFWIVVALLLFRFFVIFPKIACLHCREKHACPQAASMGVRDR